MLIVTAIIIKGFIISYKMGIIIKISVWCKLFNTTFNNISVILWQSVLLVEEIGVLTNVVSGTPHHERGSNSQHKW